MPATLQFQIQSDLRFASSTIRRPNPTSFLRLPRRIGSLRSYSASCLRARAFSTDAKEPPAVKVPDKPSICTADELHYVSIPNSDWRLALWRFNPPPQAPKRNHPLLLLSGVGTNAIGYDLSPESSFARYMSSQGFDTWILEVRGAGLSVQGSNIEQSANEISEQMEIVAKSAINEVTSSNTDAATAESEKMETVAESAFNTVPLPEEQRTNVSTSKLDSNFISLEEDLTSLTEMDESEPVTNLAESFVRWSERLSGFLSEDQLKIMYASLFDQLAKVLEDSPVTERFNEMRAEFSSLLETHQNLSAVAQFRDLSQKIVDTIDEGQRSVSPQFLDLRERLLATVEDFQKQFDLIVKYDWDFDHHLEEDVPTAMEYIREQTQPMDGKLLAIGHSMGGILLYAMLSRYGFEEKEPRLAAVVTLASSLDYTSSKSTLKLLLPLADPVQALKVSIPLGAILSATYPLSTRLPYDIAWVNHLISAKNMMHPELLEKLVLNNFCTIPGKLIVQLTTAFREGGLRDRSGNFFYKDHIHKSNVPVLAIAGDRDIICPPEAVEETAKFFPDNLVTYKKFGEPQGPHYAHYDLVGGRLAAEQLYPCIVDFLASHDST